MKLNIFWKMRVETLFGRYLEQNLSFAGVSCDNCLSKQPFTNWKVVYENLDGNFNWDVDPWENWSTFFRVALNEGYIEVVKLILAGKRCNINISQALDIDHDYAIWRTSYKGHIEIVKLLRRKPAKLKFSY